VGPVHAMQHGPRTVSAVLAAAAVTVVCMALPAPTLAHAMRTPRRAALALLVMIATLTACVSEARPSTCGTAAVTIDLALTATSLTPNDPAVCRDQEVTLVIASDVDGVFHIHGYDEAVPASTVTAGEDLTLRFTANRSGQFTIELHPADNPGQGVALGILTVYES
jgi:hypothetical protein